MNININNGITIEITFILKKGSVSSLLYLTVGLISKERALTASIIFG